MRRVVLALAITCTSVVAIATACTPTTGGGSPPTTTASGEVCGADAPTGSVVTVSGTINCDITAAHPGVKLRGSATGIFVCRNCDGWDIQVDLRKGTDAGVLRMIGGDGWTIHDSVLDSTGGSGPYGVLNIAGLNSQVVPRNWKVTGTTVRAGARNPAHEFNQDHALYVIAATGVVQNGVVENSTFEGVGYGSTVKIGGTGKGDGSDPAGVTVRNSTITNVAADGGDATGVLLVGQAAAITLKDNRILTPTIAIAMGASGNPAGPINDQRSAIDGNDIGTTPTWIDAFWWRIPLFNWSHGHQSTPATCEIPWDDMPASTFNPTSSCVGNHRS